MPIVYPHPQPRQTGWDMAGYFLGENSRAARDALLEAFTLGMAETGPRPNNPGSIGFPSGMSTTTSPFELAQIRQMGGVPTTQGGISPISYSPPTKFGIQPSLANQARQAYIQSITKSGQQQIGGQPQLGGSVLSPQMASYLAKKALEGDAEADAILQAAGY